MKRTLVITGATGLVGRALIERVLAAETTLAPEHRTEMRIVSRTGAASIAGTQVVTWADVARAVDGATHVVHLAGATVAKRWSDSYKQEIRDSRVGTTRALVKAMAAAAAPPRVLVSMSASGFYGDRGDETLTEASTGGSGFLADVCREWEAAAQPAAEGGTRVVCLRLGVVLSHRGGALPKLLRVFRLGGGGRLGAGTQWMPWISLGDAVSMIQWLMDHEVSGVVHGTAPECVTNDTFTRTLARVVGRRPFLPVPRMALEVVMGEMAGVLLGSQKLAPSRIVEQGFAFASPTLEGALRGEVNAAKTGAPA